MASVIGEAVVGKICEIAVRKLAQEANVVVKFRKDFIWLEQELRSVRGLLQDADQQSHQSDDAKQWLENIRDITMCADEVLCTTADEAILPSASQIVPVELKRSYLLPSDSHPVGIQSKVDHILNLLNNIPAFPVIAVVGMGGMGKTYLLQHVYNKAKERYEKSIWLSVSQSYSISKLQCPIASHLDLDGQIREGGDICRAAELINEKLQGKRCLVVLDDVWRASREEDLLSRLGLPSGNNSQCKIAVTT